MLVYSHNYVTIKDICKHNNLDYPNVMDAICNSDISFGNNYDTLMCRSGLQAILDDWFENPVELDWARLDDTVLISLGN